MTTPDPVPDATPLATSPAEQTPSIVVYGADWCGDCRRTTAQLRSLDVPFDYVDLVAHPEEADRAREISGRTRIPVVVYPDGSHQVEPTNLEVAAKLHLLGLH